METIDEILADFRGILNEAQRENIRLRVEKIIERENAGLREALEEANTHTDGQRVVKVTGFSCAPQTPDYWWVPSLGASMSEKHHLFATETAALDRFIADLERLATETQERLTALRLQRSLL